MTKKQKNFRLATKGSLSLAAALITVALISKAEAAPIGGFKFEYLPQDKCVLEKISETDQLLPRSYKCKNLKRTMPDGPPISPTNPGDPRQLPKALMGNLSEMQTVLDSCKGQRGAWSPDGSDGGTCRFPTAKQTADTKAQPQGNGVVQGEIFDRWGKMKTKTTCEAGGGVWDGGTGQGSCTGPRTGSQK